MEKINYDLYKQLIEKVYEYLENNNFTFDSKEFKKYAKKDLLSIGISASILNNYLEGNEISDLSTEEEFNHSIYCVNRDLKNLPEMYKDDKKEHDKFYFYYTSYKNQLLELKENSKSLKEESLTDELDLICKEIEQLLGDSNFDLINSLHGKVHGYLVYGSIYGFWDELYKVLFRYRMV